MHLLNTISKLFQSRIRRHQTPSKQDSNSLPLGLSRDQLDQIQALTEIPAYRHYLAALGHLYENNLAAMLRGLTHDAYLFQCGACYALEQIARLPGDLTDKTRELDARHTAATSPADTDAASVIFANTPFWDAYQRFGRRANRFDSAGVPLPRQ